MTKLAKLLPIQLSTMFSVPTVVEYHGEESKKDIISTQKILIKPNSIWILFALICKLGRNHVKSRRLAELVVLLI